MGNYEEIKAAVANVIKANGNKEITGEVMQNVLRSVINSLGAGAIFAGIATPSTTPNLPDARCFYLATEAGTYVNFGAAVLDYGEIAIITNETGSWEMINVDIALKSETDAKMAALKSEITNALNEALDGYSVFLGINKFEVYFPDAGPDAPGAYVLYCVDRETDVLSSVEEYLTTVPAGVSLVYFSAQRDSPTSDQWRYRAAAPDILDIALKSETDTKMAAMKSEITSLGERANCEVRIVYHSTTVSNWIRMVRPEMWNDKQYWTKDGNACTAEEAGQIADGVMISDGAHTLIVAPTHAEPMKWSLINKEVEGGYQYIEDAVHDWNGKQHTAALLADADISAEGTENAVGWCNAYERLNAQGKGFAAGSWWLPSMGELMFIMMHQKQLDYALSQIGGADLIDPDNKGYWSSTEVGVPSGQAKLPQYSLDLMHQCAWSLYCKFGAPDWYYRSTLRRVRAVTALTEGNYYNS